MLTINKSSSIQNQDHHMSRSQLSSNPKSNYYYYYC